MPLGPRVVLTMSEIAMAPTKDDCTKEGYQLLARVRA